MVRGLEDDMPELLSFFSLPQHVWEKLKRRPHYLLHFPALYPGMALQDDRPVNECSSCGGCTIEKTETRFGPPSLRVQNWARTRAF